MRWVVPAGLVGEDRARSPISENCTVRSPTRAQQYTPRTGCLWAFSYRGHQEPDALTGVAALTTRDHQSPCQMRYPLIFPSDKPEHRTKEKGMTTDDIANTHPKNTIQRHSSGRREF